MKTRFRFIEGALGVLLALPLVLAAELPGLAVSDLRFDSGSTTRMRWSTSSTADFYGLYRGRILPEGEFFRRYNHRCLATELPKSWGEDPDVPEPGSAFYYLANGLRPGTLTPEMDWGPLGTGDIVRPEGYLPCGRRVYVDPAAMGAGDGSSWADAYTSLADAVAHPSPEDRSLEMWLTGVKKEYLTVSRGQLVFYGGFQGREKYEWERAPRKDPFGWYAPAAPAASSLLQDAGVWLCEEVYFVFDGIDFHGGEHAIDLLVSGQKVEVLRSTFQEQHQQALYLATPSDYWCGIETFVDESQLYGGSEKGVLSFSIEGGDHGDLRMHRSLFQGDSPRLVELDIKDGLFDSSARIELVGNELDGGNPALSVTGRSWDGNEARYELALASNIFHHTSGNAIEMTAEGGSGEVRIEGLIAGNTISNIELSGLTCALSASGGVAACTPELDSNSISFCNEFAVKEPDDSAPGLYGDPVLVGNDLFGNSAMVLDEGVTSLNDIADVNALPGNWGNFEKDPLYVNSGAGDYHLQPGSSVIDYCLVPPPGWALIDIDCGARVLEGDGVPPRKCDIGADEVIP